MKSKTYLKLLPVLILIAAFIIVSNYAKEEASTSFEVDRENFKVVDTEDELESLLAGQSRYNGDLLIKAYQYDLMKEIEGVKVPLIDEQRDFRVESMWNHRLDLILTYSFNLLPSDKIPEAIPHLRVNELTYHPDDDDPLNMTVQTHNQVGGNYWPNDGVVYENRLYRRTVLIPVMTEDLYDQIRNWSEGPSNFNDAAESIHQVDLKNIELVTKKENGAETKTMEDVEIPYRFQEFNPKLETFQLDQSVDLKEQSSITYTKFDKHLYDDRLYFSLQTKTELRTLTFRVNGMMGNSSILKDEEGHTYIQLHHYPSLLNDEIQFSLLSGLYTTGDELDFTIEKEHLQAVQNGGKERRLERDIGEIHDVSFRLEDIRSLGEVFEGSDYAITIAVEAEGDRDLHFRPDDEEEPLHANPIIDVRDQDGESVRINLLPTSGSASQMIGLTKKDFKKVEALHIKIYNISKQVNFHEKESTFRLN
ncbi:hypothetical protein ACSVDE_06370 [Pseudalkalibacillus sp. Hm43]|uniref:hypothetical protein n=1 Tax=Pseudalkalibacillus sp. Hm43 TaxID=3450742 RepID=UPI003F43EB89